MNPPPDPPPPPSKRPGIPPEPPRPLAPRPSARAEAAFIRALDCAPEERAAFIAEVCTGNDRMDAEVRALLALHEKAGDFLDDLPASPQAEAEMARLKP